MDGNSRADLPHGGGEVNLGAPRIHGELLLLGFDVSERTISRWMERAPTGPEPVKRWRAFLENHREAIAAMDFFTVPTITFGVLYCLFVISQDRRRILHFNITKHPTSSWIIRQLREAFLFGAAPRFLIHDRDAKYGTEAMALAIPFIDAILEKDFKAPFNQRHTAHQIWGRMELHQPDLWVGGAALPRLVENTLPHLQLLRRSRRVNTLILHPSFERFEIVFAFDLHRRNFLRAAGAVCGSAA